MTTKQADRLSLLDYWRLVGEGVSLSFNRAPRFEYESGETGWFVQGGEPYVDLNCAAVFPGTKSETTLRTAVGRFRERSFPFVVCLVGEADDTARVARSIGLIEVAPLPLMLYRSLEGPPSHAVGELVVREASSELDFRSIAELSECSFKVPTELIERVMPFDSAPDPRICMLAAIRQGALVGAVTYSRSEHGHGIWSLSTHPNLRRQGIGWRVMRDVISRIRRETLEPIFLVSTPDGKPLYDRMGFETVDAGRVWIEGPR